MTTSSSPLQAPSKASVASLATLVRRVVDDVMATFLGHLELASLEARDAGAALVRVAVVAGVAVLLLASTWFLIVAAVILGLVSVGMSLAVAMALAALLNLGSGVALAASIRSRLQPLQFPATLRQLRLAIDAHSSP